MASKWKWPSPTPTPQGSAPSVEEPLSMRQIKWAKIKQLQLPLDVIVTTDTKTVSKPKTRDQIKLDYWIP